MGLVGSRVASSRAVSRNSSRDVHINEAKSGGTPSTPKAYTRLNGFDRQPVGERTKTRPSVYADERYSPDTPEEDCDAEVDIVQFASPIFYLNEDEGSLEIDVMRLGRMKGRVEVSYSSRDGSAADGREYRATSGRLIFEEGEAIKTFHVEVVQSPNWSPTFEFHVDLGRPKHCAIGLYLGKCRVKVINAEPFPTGATTVKQGRQQVLGFRIWWEFFKLASSQPGMLWRTLLVLFMDQFSNLYMVFRIWFNVYLVDVVFSTNDDTQHLLLLPGRRQQTAILMGLLWAITNLALQMWNSFKPYIGIGERTKAYLQESLFRKYLNYSNKSRDEVPSSTMLVGIMQDCEEVSGSYVCAVKIATSCVKVLLLANYIVHQDPDCAWIVAMMPVLMFVFALLRIPRQLSTAQRAQEAETAVMAFANEVCNRYRLIADFAQRPLANHQFSIRTKKKQEAERDNHVVSCNSEYFPTLLGVCSVALFMALYSGTVLSDHMSLGAFLAAINVINQVSVVFGEIYMLLMSLIQSWEAFGTLVYLYNMDTDLRQMKTLSMFSREETRKAQGEIVKRSRGEGGSTAEFGFVPDQLPISWSDVSCRDMGMAVTPRTSLRDVPGNDGVIFERMRVTTRQGRLVAVTGKHGDGRATLLKLLGKVMFSGSGHFVVPTHLRVVHVSKEPELFIQKNILDNLSFGISHPTDEDTPRIEDILKMFKADGVLQLMREQMLGGSSAEPPDAESGWQERLTSTQKAKIHLARAFAMNPEVLVLQRPLSNFRRAEANEILEIFRHFVRHRGICLPEVREGLRRPRTVFFIPEDDEQAAQADVTWVVAPVDDSSEAKTVYVRGSSMVNGSVPSAASPQVQVAKLRNCLGPAEGRNGCI